MHQDACAHRAAARSEEKKIGRFRPISLVSARIRASDRCPATVPPSGASPTRRRTPRHLPDPLRQFSAAPDDFASRLSGRRSLCSRRSPSISPPDGAAHASANGTTGAVHQDGQAARWVHLWACAQLRTLLEEVRGDCVSVVERRHGVGHDDTDADMRSPRVRHFPATPRALACGRESDSAAYSGAECEDRRDSRVAMTTGLTAAAPREQVVLGPPLHALLDALSVARSLPRIRTYLLFSHESCRAFHAPLSSRSTRLRARPHPRCRTYIACRVSALRSLHTGGYARVRTTRVGEARRGASLEVGVTILPGRRRMSSLREEIRDQLRVV
ncbi:hypothetical protein VTO73DRAFT_13078 [Trametes versicolor]